jgi:alpha-beta hydrolase superfamily lysophospholipase
VANPLRSEHLSHDPEVIAAAGVDPLNHRVATARWVAEAFAAMPATIAAAGGLRLPRLRLYADDDPIADPAAAERLFELAACSEKVKHCYAGYYHEVFNEVGRAAVFADLAAWLDVRAQVI